jgi:hypothetical protein
MRSVRRLTLLLALVAAIVMVQRRRHRLPTGDAPVWPPLDVATADRPIPAPPSPEAPTPPHRPEVVIVEGVAVDVIDEVIVPGVPHVPEVIDFVVEPSHSTWLTPIHGGCPDGHPVKVNVASGIYHVPGGRSYARTRPDRCYATPEDAEADGFRRAKL